MSSHKLSLPFDQPSIDDPITLDQIANKLNSLPIAAIPGTGSGFELPIILEVDNRIVKSNQQFHLSPRTGYLLLTGNCIITRDYDKLYSFAFPVIDLSPHRASVHVDNWFVQHNCIIGRYEHIGKNDKSIEQAKIYVYGKPNQDFVL